MQTGHFLHLKSQENKKNYKILKIKILTFLMVFVLFLPIVVSFATTEVHSISADFFNKTMTKGKLKYRSLLYDDALDKEALASSGGNASLYDRFGDDIEIVGYLGEQKFQVGLADKIYSLTAISSKKSMLEKIEDALSILFDNKDIGINNVVYPHRVDIINDDSDPRYAAYRMQIFTAYRSGFYNGHWTVVKVINSIMRYVIAGSLEEAFLDTYKNIFSGSTFDALKHIFHSLISGLLIAFVIRIFVMFWKYFKDANYKPFIRVIGEALFCIVVIEAFVYSPDALTAFDEKARDKFQTLVNESFDSIALSNAVVSGSRDPVDANLWYITMFDPWCKAMFDGRKFEECEIGTYPLSHEGKNGTLENPTADAEYTIGKVQVNSASGEVNNIAALAYSCQSAYHIDTENGVMDTSWPNATMCVHSDRIYVDDLKWVDAKMNMSALYVEGEDTGAIPTDGDHAVRSYSMKTVDWNIIVAYFNTIVLLTPVFIAAICCLIMFIKLVIAFLQMVFNCCKFLIDPENHYVFKECIIFLTTLVDYFFAVLIEAVIITLLIKNYDKGPIGMLVYFIVCLIFFFASTPLTQSTLKIKAIIRTHFAVMLAKWEYMISKARKKEEKKGIAEANGAEDEEKQDEELEETGEYNDEQKKKGKEDDNFDEEKTRPDENMTSDDEADGYDDGVLDDEHTQEETTDDQEELNEDRGSGDNNSSDDSSSYSDSGENSGGDSGEE